MLLGDKCHPRMGSLGIQAGGSLKQSVHGERGLPENENPMRLRRYLAKAHPILGIDVDGGIEDVRGDCSRCGPDVRALESVDAWWLSWDAWKWGPEE